MMTEHLVMPIINNKMKSKRKLTWLENDKKIEKIKRRPFLAYLTAGEAAKKGKKNKIEKQLCQYLPSEESN